MSPELSTKSPRASTCVELTDPHGLHARVAAELAALSRRFDAKIRILLPPDERADARDLVALLLLGARRGETLELDAVGPQAHQALAAAQALLSTPTTEGAP